MFDAWTIAGTVGGAAALTYLAGGSWRSLDGKKTLRLSLDKDGSLLGDVRLLGGALAALTSMYVKGPDTKKTLQAVAAASFISLVHTEILRYRIAKDNAGIAGPLPILPGAISKRVGGGYGAVSKPRAWAAAA
jgi:hypothetical protein